MVPRIDIPLVSPEEVREMIQRGGPVVVVDVRDDKDAAMGRIAGSLNILLVDLMNRFDEIPKERKLIIVDHAGKQSLITGRYLFGKGHTDVVRMDKGMKEGWIAAGYDVVK
jgi:rhodanese-related sulfurtransferase